MASPSLRPAGPRRRSSTMALASSSTSRALARARASSSSSPSSSVPPTRDDDLCALKTKLFLLSAQTDRGQLLFRQKVYNMEDYFRAKEQQARVVVENILSSGECKLATSPDIQDGTWELAYSTAQLFRCSPFFLAIAESMEGYTWRAPWSDESTAVCSSELFFRLHELQVMSWGASTVGKVTQTVDTSSATLSSTFDTILFRLTVIPIVGWFKLLPTFGGRVSSFASDLRCSERGEGGLKLTFELQETQVDQVTGIPKPPFFLAWLLGRRFPVNFVWKLLPWNGGRAPTCTTYVTYCDDDLRVCEDSRGEIFVYTRAEEDAEGV